MDLGQVLFNGAETESSTYEQEYAKRISRRLTLRYSQVRIQCPV